MKTNVRLLRSCMTYNSLTEEDVRKAIGMDKATFSTRMEDGDFTISQIHKMMLYIPLALEDVCSIFFSDDWGGNINENFTGYSRPRHREV